MFLFRLRIGIVYHEKNFLMSGINNNRIEQNLENTENGVKHPNQTRTAFLL